jgi:hypothetical protein
MCCETMLMCTKYPVEVFRNKFIILTTYAPTLAMQDVS